MSYFNIRSGSYIQMLKLHGATNAAGDLKPAHLYVQVTGEPTYVKASFDSATPDHTNPGGPAFSYRPRTYVPVRVAVFDEAATEAARNSAVYAGVDPATLPAVYQWPYRPEMAFSVLDLTKQQLTVSNQDKSQTTIDLTTPNADLSALFGSDVQSALLSYYLNQGNPDLLPAFGAAPEQFIFALGGDEQLATVNADGSVTFTHLGSFSDVTGSDLLSLSLYLNSDPSNILWQVELPGLHVYYKVADDLEEVNPVKLKGDPTPTYRLLGGMRLKLAYLQPPGVTNSKYTWSVTEDGNTLKHGAFMTNFRADATPQTNLNQATVYWQPGDPDPTVADSWNIDGSRDSFTGNVTFTYKDGEGQNRTDQQAFKIARRVLTPQPGKELQGSDVAMLNRILFNMGYSPQYGFPGVEGDELDRVPDHCGAMGNSLNKFSVGYPTTKTVIDPTTNKSETVPDYSIDSGECADYTDPGALGKRWASTEEMVRRLQTRDNEGLADPSPGVTNEVLGVVGSTTLERLRVHWDDYLKAYDAHDTDKTMYLDNVATGPFKPTLDTAVNGWLYTDADNNQVAAGAIPRDTLYSAWISQECTIGSHNIQWGGRGYDFRTTVSSGDEAGSIGCSQIVDKVRYNTTSNVNCPDTSTLNLYGPEDSITAMAVYADADATDNTKANCGRSFSFAFQTSKYKRNFANDGTDPTIAGINAAIRLVQVKGGTATGAPVIPGASYLPDTDEILSKALMGYNGGASRPTNKSWVSFVISTNKGMARSSF